MRSAHPKSGSWSLIRKELLTWDRTALLSLVKDLYDTSATNRDFISARCHKEDDFGEIKVYRKRIVEQFYPARGIGKLQLGEARKAIREYRKATGNLLGTIELLMTYVENGARFTNEYGDIDERFYSSMESALNEFAELLLTKAPKLYPQFRERCLNVVEMTESVGWGFHDFVIETVHYLDSKLGSLQPRI